MTDISTTSTLSILGLVLVYGAITLTRAYILGRGSLKDTEKMHRYLLIAGGLLVALSFETLDNSLELNSETALGLLLVSIGLIFITIANYIIRSNIYHPLEQISEYSAEFGKSFVGVRLPISGGVELQAFTNRFNENILSLAHRISKSEIQLEKLQNHVSVALDGFGQLSSRLLTLSDMNEQTDDVTDAYTANLKNLQSSTDQFGFWYNDMINNLKVMLTDIRGLANSGNLLAINAAIEITNLEEENPGINTIAEKLHEMAQNLEERQEELTHYWNEMDDKFREFTRMIETSMQDNKSVIEKSAVFSENLGRILTDIQEFDNIIKGEVADIRTNLRAVIDDLPNAF